MAQVLIISHTQIKSLLYESPNATAEVGLVSFRNDHAQRKKRYFFTCMFIYLFISGFINCYS